MLRLLAKRNHEIGWMRNMVVSRLHAALANLSPGGNSKQLNASDTVRLLGDFTPKTAVEQTRYDMALELLDDGKRLDVQLPNRVTSGTDHPTLPIGYMPRLQALKRLTTPLRAAQEILGEQVLVYAATSFHGWRQGRLEGPAFTAVA